MLRRKHALRAPAAAALLLLAGCATNPVTGGREFALMTEGQEISIGEDADAQIREQMGVYDSPALQGYVADLGHRIAAMSHRPNLPWRFTVVDSPAVNAFALPGGYIYLTRGILVYLGDEAELAGVLGHEIGHVTARHAVQAYSRATGAQLGLLLGQIFLPTMRSNPYGTPGMMDAAASGLGLLLLKFGRDDEIQADRLGAEYAAGGGWHPEGVAGMLSTLGRINELSDRHGVPNWLSTHPEPTARVAEVAPTVARLIETVDASRLRVDRGGYLERIVGVRYGDNPEEGIARGREFVHPVLRLGVEFPEGWEIQNSAAVVVARQPGRNGYMALQLVEEEQAATLEAIAERDTPRDARNVSAASSRINGLDAYVRSYQRDLDDIGAVMVRVAYLRYDGRVYMLGGVIPVADYTRIEREVDRSIRSFRVLSAEEAARILPHEIALYEAAAGDTWQRIAQRAGGELVPAATLAIMNGYPVDEQPRAGERLKIVVQGQPVG